MSDAPKLPGLDLQEVIARTNLSEVWKGVRSSDRMPVVVKLATPAAGPDALRDEALAVGALLEAGVQRIVPAEYAAEPLPHLVLPWKGGRTMRDALDDLRGGDDRARLVDAFLRVVETVAQVHAEGFLHGDLKPENVLLDAGRPWLTDFGLARTVRNVRLDTQVSVSLSREGGWGGTLHYLPPEGLQGGAPTPSWDVYALGVMLHEILLGRRPDRAATPDQLRTLLPGEVVELLLEALAYSPADRLRSAGLLLRRLRDIGNELTAMGPRRWLLRSGRWILAGLAAFFVTLRYGMVLALGAGYLALLGASSFHHPAWLLGFLPLLLLHITIRWEGPESGDEAALRRSSGVVK